MRNLRRIMLTLVMALAVIGYAQARPTGANKEQLRKISLETLAAIQSKDLKKLSTLVNPQGLMISLSPHIQKDTYVRFTPRQLAGLNKSVKTVWGTGIASGESVSLTFDEYHAKYLWPVDYLGKEIQVNYDDSISSKGSTVANFKTEFKNGKAVEYFFKGTPKNGNMDWKSMILIYEEVRGQLRLSAILNDYFTP